MKHKIGVYIDTGYGIGEALDIDALCKVATTEFKKDVALCKSEAYWADKDKLEIIRNDIAAEELTTVIIAGPSSRQYQEEFKFGTTVVERVNLREHVVWVQPPNDEDTQMMAADYIRLGIIKASKYDDRKAFQEDTNKDVLVIGGGMAGMTAALETARAGYTAHLVEKEPKLGGWMNNFSKVFLGKAPYDRLTNSPAPDLAAAVMAHPNVKVYTSSRIYSIAGSPGMFDAVIRPDGPWIEGLVQKQNEWLAAKKAKEAQGTDKAKADEKIEEPKVFPDDVADFERTTVRVGAVVVAAGWRPEDAAGFKDLGYGTYPDVITSVQFEEIASSGRITRPSDGRAVDSIAFLDCGDQASTHPMLFDSTVSSLVALKQAHYLLNTNSDGRAYIFYENMRTIGQYEKYYQTMQNMPGVFMSKATPVSVSNGSGGLSVELKDTLLGDKMKVKVDMVVISTGMTPVTKDSAVVNLQYRQGPFLPENPYGFNDSHFICFPYETQRTGIYTAGCVKHPMDLRNAEMDARGAALKAIQCVELVAQGKAVFPRAGDESYPELAITRCTQCKRCTEECPFGMYDETENGTPLPNPTRCRRCGICMGSCPERIITFRDHSVDMIGSMIKGIDVPDEYSEKPRVLALMCENDAFPALDMAGINRLHYSPHIRFIPLRCLGNVSMVWISDALSKGIDGILLIGCKFGDDYQCHFMKGSELADIRMSKFSETLTRLMLGSERIRVEQLAIDEFHKLPEIIDSFVATLEESGPNPYKGF